MMMVGDNMSALEAAVGALAAFTWFVNSDYDKIIISASTTDQTSGSCAATAANRQSYPRRTNISPLRSYYASPSRVPMISAVRAM
jgi:hypothetical protein